MQEKGLMFLELLTHEILSSCSSAHLHPRPIYERDLSIAPCAHPPTPLKNYKIPLWDLAFHAEVFAY